MAAFGLKALHPSSTATDDRPHVLGFATARTTAGLLILDCWNGPTSASRKFTIDKDGNLGVYGNIRPQATTTLIGPATSDTADTGRVFLIGGGEAASTRGSYIELCGNESSDTGAMYIVAGDVAGGSINIGTGGTNAGYITRAGVWTLGTGAVETGASRGDLVVKNTTGVRSVNNAGNNTYQLIGGNSSDQVVLASGGGDIKWGRPEVALGGGSSATLGTIGGSGPSNAAQNGWLRVVNSTGSAIFLPTFL